MSQVPTQSCSPWKPRDFSLGTLRLERKADTTPPSRTELKNGWSCILHSPLHIIRACLGKKSIFSPWRWRQQFSSKRSAPDNRAIMLNIADSRQTDKQTNRPYLLNGQSLSWSKNSDSYANPHYSESRQIHPTCFLLINWGQIIGCFPQKVCEKRLTGLSSQCVHI